MLRSLFVALAAALVSATLWAELRAGAAMADITPPLGGRMYGYGARGDNVSTGVHDPLLAKALVLASGDVSFALVTVDLGSFGKPYTEAVRRRVFAATDLDALYVVASHTHSAPVFDESFPSAEAPWLRTLEQTLAETVIRAARALAPAGLAVGWGDVDGCHNRRLVRADGSVHMLWGNREGRPTSPVDKKVAVVAVDSPSGEPIATVVNFACHPVVLGPENLEISADFPGAMAALVEEELGGLAMFAQGAAGDLNPFWDKTPPADGGFEQMAKLGQALGREVVRVRTGLVAADPGRIDTERQLIALEARWDLDDPAVRAAFDANQFGWIFERYRARFARESEAEVNTVVIGDRLAFATFPGEFFVEHQMRLRQASMIENTLFFGYTNGELGYFPTVRAAAEGGYGGKEATIVEVGAGERLVNRALVQIHYQAGKLHRVPRFD